ncbi:MAG: hypothetical protein ACI9WU_002937 [Myxococcota bacterium]|jgi:hypothetical protein
MPESRSLVVLCALLAVLPARSQTRVVAIGDLHGDYEAARKVLRLTGLLDADDNWAGKDTILVQTGDVLDRGDGEHRIMALLAKLAKQAPRTGGQVVRLNGNHEIMNARGDLRYVTPGALGAFGGPDRATAFKPGGTWAKRLAEFPVTAIVDGTLFVHGGVRLADVEQLAAINAATRAWLQGQAAFPKALGHGESVIWTRFYAPSPLSEAACTELKAVLARSGAQRMVVGHTVQKHGITSDCDGRLWRVDVGMSAHYGGKPAAIEIRANRVRVLR